MIRSGNYRWLVIASLLATITAINCIDRQTLAVVVAEVKKDIAISEAEYGRMTSMFLVGYAMMYVGGGWLVDRVGTRWGLRVDRRWLDTPFEGGRHCISLDLIDQAERALAGNQELTLSPRTIEECSERLVT